MKSQIKSQQGITMISLIIYVASFLAITTVVAGITTFFYSNMQIMDMNQGSNSVYNKLNLYLVNECKKPGVSLYAYRNIKIEDSGAETITEDISRIRDQLELIGNPSSRDNNFITFLNSDGTKNSFIYDRDNEDIYYNKIRICDNVKSFQVKVDTSTGKDVLNIFVNIDDSTFQTKYVVGS